MEMSPKGDKMVEFFASMTISPSQIKKMWDLLKEHEPKKWAFENIIFTPIRASKGTVEMIKKIKKEENSTIMFDSGGFYVQQDKLTMEELLRKSKQFYEDNNWGDWYVLPDSPPVSSDGVEIAWGKVHETIYCAKSFSEEFNGKYEKKFIPVVQGITKEQIYHCVKSYSDLNVKRIGFGSFGTSGKNNAINILTKKSLENLRYLSILAKDYGFELHAFGIGGPSSINRIREYIDSFDSSSWDKAGGFGDVFLPNKRINITGRSPRISKNHYVGDNYKFNELRNNHECYFCSSLKELRENRIYRSLHNIMITHETVKKWQEDTILDTMLNQK